MNQPLAYYNEVDPYAAAWLRNLIDAGHIAKGLVDTRSIEDVRPDDLQGFTQCHFFAGIGIWSHALRLAGWPDGRPVWTGSCPCQPFSAAGKGGGFADQRHLWPHWFHLVGECRPPVIFGEQVAGKDAEPWIDLVQDDLEAVDYALGAIPFPAAGVGAPHIRDRLYWVAERLDAVQSRWDRSLRPPDRLQQPLALANPGDPRLEGWPRNAGREALGLRQPGRMACKLADAAGERPSAGPRTGECRADAEGLLARGCLDGGLGHAHEGRGRRDTGTVSGAQGEIQLRPVADGTEPAGAGVAAGPGPTNGYWSAADWLHCRDLKWRPVEPGTFPLVNGDTARVGRLRAFGNAIVAPAAEAFIRSYLDAADWRTVGSAS